MAFHPEIARCRKPGPSFRRRSELTTTGKSNRTGLQRTDNSSKLGRNRIRVIRRVPDSSFYEASFELHPDALVILTEGAVRALNVQAESLFGYPREELIGRKIDLLLPSTTEPGIGRRKDGSAFPAEIVTRELSASSLLYVVRAARGTRASEQALLDANQLNLDIFKSTQVGLIVLNQDLRYVAWNPKMEEISGLAAHEVLGKRPLDLFPFLKEAGAEQLWHRALNGETVTSPDYAFEVPQQGRKGWNTQTVGPLRNARGEIVGVIVSVSDITVRKHAEDAMRESEERFRGVVESSPIPMLVAADRRRVVLLNKRFTDLFGYTMEDVPDIDSWELRAYPDPAYRREVRERWSRAEEAADCSGVGKYGPVEARVTGLDGAVRLVEVHVCRRGNVSLVIFNDVTERRQAEEAVRENEARLLRIVEALPVMIAALDASGQVVFWNRECERVTGYGADEMVGNPAAFPLLFPDERLLKQALSAISQEQLPTDPWRVTRKDGVIRMVRWFRVTTLPVASWARWGVGLDVTDQFRLEEQLRQVLKMQALGQLAGGVAHDFNNVLTAINGFSDLVLQRMAQGDPHYDMIHAVRNAGARAARLVKQLLLFSRKAVANPELLNLRELLTQSLGMLRRLIDEDIRIDLVSAPDLGGVEADAGQIEQVLVNLCLNARDAMPGGGTLTVKAENLQIDEAFCVHYSGGRPGDFVHLSVTDTGIGMTPEVQAHLFEPFFTTKPAGAGTGLGLATVYGIVQQAGGFITVESKPGKGTSVHVYLPMTKAPTAEPAPPEPVRHGHGGGETILLVEDDEPVRRITCLFLEENGYHVLAADSGPAALRLAGEIEGPIHLLVSDVVMPDMSGGELAGRMVAVRPDIKVLFISGYNEDEIVQRGMMSSNLLQKPFTEEDLVTKVRETLEDGRSG